MKKKVYIVIICIFVYLSSYLIIYNYTNKINKENINSLIDISNENINYSEIFLREYIDTIINEKDEDGYKMLDEDTKKLFNNSLSSYSDNIKYIRLVINKFIKEKTVTDLNIIGKKYSDNNGFKGEVIDCEIISTIWSYIEISDLYYCKDYRWFKNLKLKEYSFKKYKISFDEIEKEDEKWKVNFK